MKIIKIIMFLIAVSGYSSQVRAQSSVTALTPEEFKAMAEKTKGLIIDVRDTLEYNFAHIPDAVQIGVESADFITRIGNLDKNKSYFVYCGIGKRSATAISIMQKEGFKHLYNLKGGFLEWKKQEMPIIKHK